MCGGGGDRGGQRTSWFSASMWAERMSSGLDLSTFATETSGWPVLGFFSIVNANCFSNKN